MSRRSLLMACAIVALGLANTDDAQTSGQEPKPAARAAKVAPAQKPRAVAAQADVEDAMVQQVEQQFGPMIRQMVKAELHFIKVVCEPSKPEFEKLTGFSDEAAKALLRQYAQVWRGGRQDSDPRSAMMESLAKAVQTTLSPEQVDRYRKELDLRTAALKRAVVMNLVAGMDRRLVLRRDQREQLKVILADNWHESWSQTQILMYGGQYMPTMPDDKINPILTEAQQAIWRGVQKGNVHFGFHFGIFQQIQIGDDVWDDEAGRKPANPPNDRARPKDSDKK